MKPYLETDAELIASCRSGQSWTRHNTTIMDLCNRLEQRAGEIEYARLAIHCLIKLLPEITPPETKPHMALHEKRDDNPELTKLLAEARRAYDAMTPEEKEEMHREQAKSWARSCKEKGEEKSAPGILKWRGAFGLDQHGSVPGDDWE
ncbi:MAG TPA: hypothetical protein VHY35_17860 [Stellaceae bacterium]|nr:hypothetical protein [Stellaceae bacterium]